MGCCGPSTCFTCNDRPKRKDACMCGCGYFNGMWTIFVAQLFTFAGAILSLATLGDCSFADIDPTTFDLNLGRSNSSSNRSSDETKESRSIGFITFENAATGHCHWYSDMYNDDDDSTNTPNGYGLQAYWQILGDTWDIAMILSWLCAVVSWYFFLYSISFCCSSQVKCCRYLNGFFLAIVLVILQGCTFIVFSSDFCTVHNCSFGRTAGYSIGAMVCYSIAGIAFFLSSDYPGDLYDIDNNNGNDLVQPVEEVTYHEDPNSLTCEVTAAKRISQQRGGGVPLVAPPLPLPLLDLPTLPTNVDDNDHDHYNDHDDDFNNKNNSTNINEESYDEEPSMNSCDYLPVITSAAAEPLVKSDMHPGVDAQY